MLTFEEEDQVRRGLAASSLLENEDLRDLIKALTVESFAVFTETKPHEVNKREEHYHLAQALKAIEAELLSRVQLKDAIERRVHEIELATDAIENFDENDINE